MKRSREGWRVAWVAIVVGLTGCVRTGVGGRTQIYAAPAVEAAWIRDGEPLRFEGEEWYPRDGFDVLTDDEVLPLGEFRGVPFFVAKADVRPFRRLYTKFGRNKFRIYERAGRDDPR